MSVLFAVLYFATLVFMLLLFGRFVLDWVQVLAHDWRPSGVSLVVAEVVYSATDPPLKGLRRVLPPIRMGQISFDLAFLVLLLGCSMLLTLFGRLSAG